MKSVVQFEHVSKEYRLGVGRRNILKIVSQSLSNALNAKGRNAATPSNFWALHDLSFELTQGESLALIGRNGAGKSTLLKLLAKITRPTQGQITINGRLSALIELGSGFHPDLTGRENIYLNGTILGLKRREIAQHFDEIVAFSEIEHFLDTPVKRYSSGMMVRLGFAVASCLEADLLLVDEVLAVGDVAFRQKCIQRIDALRHNGTSIIFVSHNLYMVQAICERALYLERGHLKASGPTTEVIKQYERDLHEERAQKLTKQQSGPVATVTEVQISQIQLLNGAGVVCTEFQSDQPLEIRVHYLVYSLTETVNAVIRIMRTDGVTCCIMRTTADGVPLALQPGPGVLSVIVEPLQLTSNSYFIDARLTNALDNLALAGGWSNWFRVGGTSQTQEEQGGIFEPKRSWYTQMSPVPNEPNDLAYSSNGHGHKGDSGNQMPVHPVAASIYP